MSGLLFSNLRLRMKCGDGVLCVVVLSEEEEKGLKPRMKCSVVRGEVTIISIKSFGIFKTSWETTSI
ncbi:hypothetical protein A2982_00885 [candidate division WWE3 bacterium RIFCSPLOWO2_01_FULL_39_13]|uniref:Uncharacterized protein n=1 Tax=candidate division WWE3 bacterium RIFCSPLOWO2_01_FULL_39_13 TaxID=1802624 RepID=A0A1F4V5I5_UNCKA|nr:MAG: hypothetical protein A2982_00885 [candidate division WWE3 bacterium RIFCSPLOWO2_01_FULL_39_13]